MSKQSLYASLAALLAATVFTSPARAEQHSSEALKQATEAASSTGDSKAVAEHATEALKHIDAAKAQASSPGEIRHLNKSEAELKSAVKNAGSFNADTAAQDAKDAKSHLEQAIHK